MKLLFSRQALADISDISDYLRARSLTGARRVRAAILSSLQVITAHPYAGRAVERGLRKHGLVRYPYIIYYRVDERERVVEVVTIRHAARDDYLA